jgi:hypothetical protein
MSDTPPPPVRRAPSVPPPAGPSLVRWEGGHIPVAALMHPPLADPDYELALWVESGSERVLGARFVPRGTGAEAAAELVRETVERSVDIPAGTPSELLVTDAALAGEIRGRLTRDGVRVRVVEACQSWEVVVREFGAFLAAHWPGRSYLSGREVTPECIDGFFRAASAFYRQAPWKVLGETPIEVRLADRAEPLYAVVLGSERSLQGLTLYLSERPQPASDGVDAHPVRTEDTVAITFDREDSIPPLMLEERRAHRWALAGPAAFPLPYRRLADGTMREPDAEEFALLTVALRAVAEFAERRSRPSRSGRSEVEAVPVPGTAGGSIVRLTLPADSPGHGSAD